MGFAQPSIQTVSAIFAFDMAANCDTDAVKSAVRADGSGVEPMAVFKAGNDVAQRRFLSVIAVADTPFDLKRKLQSMMDRVIDVEGIMMIRPVIPTGKTPSHNM